MFGENALPIYLVIGVVVTLVAGSTFTPVISRTTWVDPQETTNEMVIREYAYCQSDMDDVNCACFSNVAGYILSEKRPDFRGTQSMNTVDLARSQATEAC